MMFSANTTDASDVWTDYTTTGDTNWISVDTGGTSNIDNWINTNNDFTGNIDFKINWHIPEPEEPRIKTFEKEFML